MTTRTPRARHEPEMSVRRFFLLAAALGTVACKPDETGRSAPTTVTVERRDIVVDVEATGVVEPINIIEVKSKASGQITQLTVETGSDVKRGDLLVQLDTREVNAQLQQAQADLDAAEARRDVSLANKVRSDTLFAQRVITAQENEAAKLDLASAQAALVRAEAALDQAQQRSEDVTVRAPIDGTILTRTVSAGQVIASATSSASGGTTLLTMADLSRVRVRVNVSEADIGAVRPGMPAMIATDAYPNRPFDGVVEKIEPQALVVQSVTNFPILVSIDNRDGLLRPGMNSEVTIEIDRRPNVLSVANDAVRMPREAMNVAPYLGLTADSVQVVLAAAGVNANGFGGMGARGMPQTSRGDVALASATEQGPRGRQGGGQQQPQVTDEQCSAVTAAFAKDTATKRQIDAIRARMQSQELDMRAGMQQLTPLYQKVGVDARTASACQRRTSNVAAANGDTRPAQPGAQQPGAQAPGDFATRRGRGGRTGVVFVAGTTGTYTPRVVQIGVANFDYTEILSGLEEGEQVALLGAIALQIQREESAERMRSRGGIPGLQRQDTGTQGGPGGGRPGGPGGGGGR